MKIVIASNNKGKVKEFKQLLQDLPVEVISMGEYEGCPVTEEDRDSFQGNALKKAETVASFTKEVTIADDSGLEVDYLGGQPGVRSARYAGDGASDEENNKKLLKALEGVPDEKRTARFKCAIALTVPPNKTKVVLGSCEGKIATEARGTNGFGYDPLFIVPQYGKTFAELREEVKNQISHRGEALRQIKKEIIYLLKIRG
jgi:XTP/dITP diphosphohydrolase